MALISSGSSSKRRGRWVIIPLEFMVTAGGPGRRVGGAGGSSRVGAGVGVRVGRGVDVGVYV